MTHPIVEGMTEAVTMAKLMRENEELRRELARERRLYDVAHNECIKLRDALADEKARLSDGEEYQGYTAVKVDGELYVHHTAHDDVWSDYKKERALADRFAQGVLNFDDGFGLGTSKAALSAYRKARGL